MKLIFDLRISTKFDKNKMTKLQNLLMISLILLAISKGLWYHQCM